MENKTKKGKSGKSDGIEMAILNGIEAYERSKQSYLFCYQQYIGN